MVKMVKIRVTDKNKKLLLKDGQEDQTKIRGEIVLHVVALKSPKRVGRIVTKIETCAKIFDHVAFRENKSLIHSVSYRTAGVLTR